MLEEKYLLISDDGPGFHTIEGEGELIGTPSVFMRLFGCNLTCKGWASADSPWGCDSYISWSKKNKYTFDQMFNFYDENGLTEKLMRGDVWKITGGEPMLRQEPLLEFVQAFYDRYNFIPTIDFETNGTIKPDDRWVQDFQATFTVSPKMSNNGDPVEKRFKPEVLDWHCKQDSCFKFVIGNENDLEELKQVYLSNPEFYIAPSRVWLMVCAGSRQEHIERASAVAEYAKKLGVNFSPRLQLIIWDKALKV
jgi:organic radical activating enzyme